jgi:hypothetical protein
MGRVALHRTNHIIVVKVEARRPILKFTRFLGLLHKDLLRGISLRFARLRSASTKLLSSLDFLVISVSFLVLLNSHEAVQPNCR